MEFLKIRYPFLEFWNLSFQIKWYFKNNSTYLNQVQRNKMSKY